MSVETIYIDLKAAHIKKYIDLFEIDEDKPIDPLAMVVPTTEFFFGTYALNLIIFTKIYGPTFDLQLEQSKARLIGTYHLFAKYETHIFIQSDALDIQNANPATLNTFHNKLSDLAAELSEVGVFYHGQQSEVALKDTIDEVLESFSADT